MSAVAYAPAPGQVPDQPDITRLVDQHGRVWHQRGPAAWHCPELGITREWGELLTERGTLIDPATGEFWTVG